MKIRLIAFFSAFGLTIVAAVIGNVLEAKGLLNRDQMTRGEIAAVMGVYFALFCLLCFTIVPLALRLFIRGQVKIGNGELRPIKWLQEHENATVLAVWAYFILGLLIIYLLAKDDIMREFL